VILPALNRQPRNGDNELVLWQEVMVNSHLHLIAAPLKSKAENNNDTVYDFLKNLENTRTDNELVRLLYVSATRAHRQLHLIASIQANKDGEIKPTSNSLLQTLWPALEADFSRAASQNISKTSVQLLDLGQFISKLQRLNSNEFINGVLKWPNQQKISINNQFKQFGENSTTTTLNINESLLSEDLNKNCGTLAHLYMELFAKVDLKEWTSQRLRKCQPAMQKWLIQKGHTVKNSEFGSEKVLAALETTLACEAGLWVLQKHTNAASELSLLQVQEEGIKNNVIDRTFIVDDIDGNKVRWIVDYKLTTFDESITSLAELAAEAEQHRLQLDRYAALFSEENLAIKKAVLFLSLGKLIEL
jgi:ATP-dependent exoDNAse (exonuclease V) beta subunit